jgi:hypothetical protein
LIAELLKVLGIVTQRQSELVDFQLMLFSPGEPKESARETNAALLTGVPRFPRFNL